MEAYFTAIIVIILIISLYKNLLKPSLIFILAVFLLIIAQVITVEDFLLGLANKQIVVIFLLMILTSGLRTALGNDFFFRLFKKNLSPFSFRLRMMALVASVSSLLNNTPVVAFMIPYVKSWTDEQNYPASKFLIPLSFATILGGMITVVGTSTNLVLNGLISQQNLSLLKFTDFFFLGLLVTITGILYLAFFSDKFLPEHRDNKETVMEQIKDYIVETFVAKNSPLIGKTIQEAGLRHLKELFLVEIKRGDRLITPVDPSRILQESDRLYFTGNTHSILRLINEKNGLKISEDSHISKNKFFKLSEAIIPTGSSLIGQTLKSCDFRDTYKGSVISVYRNREKVSGNLGEIKLTAGDLLLMLVSEEKDYSEHWKDLILLQKKGNVEKKIEWKSKWNIILTVLLLLLGITGILDLFLAVLMGILLQIIGKLTNLSSIKNALDLDLLVILICALAIGTAIRSSGAADLFVNTITNLNPNLPSWSNIAILFITTLILTSIITNAAAVSIMFPIAYQMAELHSHHTTPYFVAIAFAASADFITPIGYQTNLMVMGPGNYAFKDYTKIGLPLTIIYSIIVLTFINYYYQL
ncbi:SLC13 family permease [Shivajiella indica]|uniref:SLC13 family permease n=1 Tax=Shivajiella indica TaxID=872115 RepID=A0ABW5BDV9_9BACT